MHWKTPQTLEIVRSIQRESAMAAGAGYWNWASVTGGAEGFDHWVQAWPPLVRPDHVHFTVLGYETSASAFFNYLMDGYAKVQRQGSVKTRAGNERFSGTPRAAN